MTPFQSLQVAEKFASYPVDARKALLALREIAWETARSLPAVGEIEETLKWGEPAYGTPSKAGSTFRMDWKAKAPGRYALYFNCQTDLVDTFKTLFPNDFVFGLWCSSWVRPFPPMRWRSAWRRRSLTT